MQKTGAVGAAAIFLFFAARILGGMIPGVAGDFLSQILSAGIPALLLLFFPKVELPRVTLPDRRGWAHFLYLPLFLLTVLVFSVLSSIFAGLFGVTAPEATGTLPVEFLNYVLAPALAEEFFFRFLLLRLFLPYGKSTAVWLSSILFALIHLNLAQIPYAFAAGLFLGALALSSESIWIPFLFHFTNNALSVASSYGNALSSFFLFFFIAVSCFVSFYRIKRNGSDDPLAREMLASVRPDRETGRNLRSFARTLLLLPAILCIVLSFIV